MWWYVRMLSVPGMGAARRSFITASRAPARCSAFANRSRTPIEVPAYQMLWSRRVFAIPGITMLVVFVLARPQEFVALLARLPFLHLFTLLAVLGYVLDVRLRRLQPVAANTLPWVIAFFVWAVLSTAITAPATLISLVMFLIVLFALYGTVAHGIQGFRTFQIVAIVLGIACTFIAGVCFHQGLSPQQCIAGIETEGGVEGEPDGRICDST